MENIENVIPIKLSEDEKQKLILNHQENSLLKLCPSLAEEWDYELNGDLKPNMIARYSNKKVWWHCPKNHKWYAVISKRPKAGCPYCKGNLVLEGLNDLESNFPEIAKEWDYEKNGDLLPSMVTKSTGKLVWWKCEKNHSYKSKVLNRTLSNQGCPYCANQKVLKGFNDLETTNPEIVKEWDYEKNKDLLPSMLTRGTSKKVWWKCQNNHSYQSRVMNKTILNQGCPYCSNQKALKGFNDLETTHPNILKEWDYTKNSDFPQEYTFGSRKKVWWICNKNHSYKSSIIHRINGSGCPYCNESKGEKKIREFLKSNNFSFISQYKFSDCKDKKSLPFDFALFDSSKNLICCIEYDGIQHFEPIDFTGNDVKKAKEKFEIVKLHDEIKNDYCKIHNIKLIRISYNEFDNIEKILLSELNIT